MAEYDLPKDIRYSREDEWIRAEDGGRHRVGITDYAQKQLGDVVFVELPEVGAHVEAGQSFGVIESVKAVSDLYAPAGGEVLEINEALDDEPEKVNADCYGEGWLIVIKLDAEDQIDGLLDATAYQGFIDERAD